MTKLFSQAGAFASLASLALLLPGAVFAQSVNATPSASSTATYYPGQQSAVIGTIQLSTPTGTSAQVASLPLMFAGVNGASLSNLQNCSLYNYGVSSDALMNGVNIASTIVAGANSFRLDTPLTVTSSPTTLTLRCNISSAAPGNSGYVFDVGSPIITTANLGADLTVFPNLVQGALGAPVAAMTLDSRSSSANLVVSSLPVSASYAGGLSSAYLTNCSWKNGNTSITSNSSIASGANGFGLTSSVTLVGGASAPMTLVLVCDVSASAPVGSTLALSFNPSALGVTNANTGGAVSATTGPLNSYAGTAAIIPSASGTGGSATPGVPNTGAGGNSALTLAIMGAALLGLLGALYLYFRLAPASHDRG